MYSFWYNLYRFVEITNLLITVLKLNYQLVSTSDHYTFERKLNNINVWGYKFEHIRGNFSSLVERKKTFFKKNKSFIKDLQIFFTVQLTCTNDNHHSFKKTKKKTIILFNQLKKNFSKNSQYFETSAYIMVNWIQGKNISPLLTLTSHMELAFDRVARDPSGYCCTQSRLFLLSLSASCPDQSFEHEHPTHHKDFERTRCPPMDSSRSKNLKIQQNNMQNFR